MKIFQLSCIFYKIDEIVRKISKKINKNRVINKFLE